MGDPKLCELLNMLTAFEPANYYSNAVIIFSITKRYNCFYRCQVGHPVTAPRKGLLQMIYLLKSTSSYPSCGGIFLIFNSRRYSQWSLISVFALRFSDASNKKQQLLFFCTSISAVIIIWVAVCVFS